MSEDRPLGVSLDRFGGDDWVALEARQFGDPVRLTADQARVLAADLVAHAEALDGGST